MEFNFGTTKKAEDGSDERTSGRRTVKCRLTNYRGSGQKSEVKPETIK